MVKVGILGYGTVGSGVFEILDKNSNIISKRAGQDIEVKYVLDLRDFPGDPAEKYVVHDFSILENDDEVKIVVETMGGLHPAYEFVKASLLKGKNVVTSNKALVASFGTELLQIARDKNVNFLFEASVGGGIPIIRPLNQALTADEITKITGIMNGTTNYILTKMSREGSSYQEVLKEAQELGYAERNPEADVEGYDACRKIAILTSLAGGKTVNFEEITTEGITKISNEDFKYADKLGCVIKLLATSYRKNGKVYAITSPFLIDKTHPLYNVNGVLNGIYVNGNMVGDVMFFGAGAGKLPTASAVVGDIIDCVKHKGTNVMVIWDDEKLTLADTAEEERRFFVRVSKDVKESQLEELFGDVRIVNAEGLDAEYGFITGVMTEEKFALAAAKINVISRIRIDDTKLN
mgnify:CR=1 FL=1